MKRTVPLIITGVSGLILVISAFVPWMVRLGEDTAVWFDLLAGIAFILGGGNLLMVHLKKISDRAAGWGYSGVTIVAFLFTLYVGLFKVGVAPEPSTEHYGESFVPFPLDNMPIATVDGTIPRRADEERLPASSLRNISQDGVTSADVETAEETTSPSTEEAEEGVAGDDEAEASEESEAGGETGRVVFRGWMTDQQKNDLMEYDTSLEWQCLVEQLHGRAQPEFAQGRIFYHSDHEALGFSGYMTNADFENLTEMLEDVAGSRDALQRLRRASRVPTVVVVPAPPEGVVKALSPPDEEDETPETPTPAGDLVFTSLYQPNDLPMRVDEAPKPHVFLALGKDAQGRDTLTILGPMSARVRNDLAEKWPEWPRMHPIAGENNEEVVESRQRLADAFIAELEGQGQSLSKEQREAVAKQFATISDVQQIIDAINAAGVATEETRTACDMLAERREWERSQAESNGESASDAGPLIIDPEEPKEDDQVLNEQQVAAIRDYAANSEMTVKELKERLTAAHPEGNEFFANTAERILSNMQPTIAAFRRQVAFALLEAGPLSDEQKESLFAGYRLEYNWRRAIEALFVKAHVTKYSWSGSHEQEGSWFWWCYAYLFRPLTSTMFAMLAFYVASAAFRAFRAKNFEALLLLGTAFIILLGHTFVGVKLTEGIPPYLSAFKIDELSLYVAQIFMTAGNRAIMIGIALGVASTSLKVLLGVDRSYLGSGDD
jgi:hypothetical protein